MAIVETDIRQRLSGGASNADPNASLGGARSSQDAPQQLFDTVSGSESSAGSVEYRCVYIHNTHATLTWQAAKVWIQTNTVSSATQIAIGLGSSAVNGTEQTVANEVTAPSGVTFSEPADATAGLLIGDIPSGQHKAVWIRRTVNAGAAPSNDNYVLRTNGDSLP